jgi:Leucine Rich repeat
MQLGNEGVEFLFPAALVNVTSLKLQYDTIHGRRGGDVLRNLLVGNNTIITTLSLADNRRLGPEAAIGLGQGLFTANTPRLQTLNLSGCVLGIDGLANLLLPAVDGMINNALTDLNLDFNDIEGAEGGRLIALLLLRCSQLKVLHLCGNNLGPRGANAMAPGLAAPDCHLEELRLWMCGLGNDGVMNLVPDGQVNRSLTTLGLLLNNIQETVSGDNVVLALAACCTNLARLSYFDVAAPEHATLGNTRLNPEQQLSLDLLLQRKRLDAEAQALAGSTFSVLFRFVEEQAHPHEHGLGAIFVILRNDGKGHFCTAHNRTAPSSSSSSSNSSSNAHRRQEEAPPRRASKRQLEMKASTACGGKRKR